jgi:hypothetical protein
MRKHHTPDIKRAAEGDEQLESLGYKDVEQAEGRSDM